MKKLVLLAVLACASAAAVTVSDGVFTLDEREKALVPHCAAQGGCAVISRAELINYVQGLRESWLEEIREAFAQAVKQEAKKVCGNTI